MLRTPPLTKQLGDHAAELIVGVDSAFMVACASSVGLPMGIEGLISTAGRPARYGAAPSKSSKALDRVARRPPAGSARTAADRRSRCARPGTKIG